ncbi:MAG: hypothetical protein KZQ94_04085 [Candidatus Thiodiazotropha sp. (ex Troendleina suluensis)]|nr:hypothetical protein [Candidatus Thiodiazotropha sp. (ex Troendleina suluensis)]
MSEFTEEEYVSSLKEQRHMYEWCLKNIGGLSDSDAKKEAEILYSYKPESEEHRYLVLHEDAWHWAMLKINGEQYWLSKPELETPSIKYSKEYENYINENT